MLVFPKILSAEQTRKVDAFTIENEPILSIDLMERASMAFANVFVKFVNKNSKIAVVCGTGNNGGDGFAISRLLIDQGFHVIPYLVKFSEQLSSDCQTNYSRVTALDIQNEQDIPDFVEFDIIIDALLGTGLKRPVTGLVQNIIKAINFSNKPIYSVDIASGIFCDHLQEDITAIESFLVISFQRPKMAFFMPEYGQFIQQWKFVNIGLDEDFIQSQDSQHFVLNDKVKRLLKPRKKFSHKGTYGHALVIAGSHGKIGAAVLASKACLKSGAGLLTVHIPGCGYEIVQTSIPEAMCTVDENQEVWSSKVKLSGYNSVGVGPGIGTSTSTLRAFRQLLSNVQIPLVIDADGINLLAQNKDLIELIPDNSILTPHVKEFDRLIGSSKNASDRWEKQKEFAQEHRLIIILKDAHTSIADPEGNLFFNSTGNPGMATAGSGDVLTGIITGLIAQNYSPLESALIGVYFHGLAGDKASERLGEMSVIASDITHHLNFTHI